MTEELKPCPFCGGDVLTRDVSGIFCETCKAQGPMNYDAPGTAWNTRSNRIRMMKDIMKMYSRICSIGESVIVTPTRKDPFEGYLVNSCKVPFLKDFLAVKKKYKPKE